MSQEIAEYKASAPVEITTTAKLEEIAVKIDAHGKTAIESILTVGKLLCEARDILPANNEFGEWREKRLPWLNQKMAYRWMNAYQNGGEKLIGQNVRTSVLYELTAPDVPESAREAATKEESLTVKQAKELAAAHRRIQELESPRKANLDNLIPGLMKKYKGASLTIGMANRLSVLDHEQQKSYLELLESKQWAENKTQKLADEKLRALEDLAKATRERDEIKAQLEKVSKSDTASVLIEKEQELKRIREDYQRKLFEQKKEAEKTASEIHEQRFKDQIKAAEEAAEKARRERKEAVEGRGAANKEVEKLEREIEALKSQLEVDSPTNVDNARIRHIEDAGRGLLVSLNELRKDMDRIGGGMEGSISTAEEVIKKASLELTKLQGMQDSIITI